VKSFAELSEREILALAIASEEDDTSFCHDWKLVRANPSRLAPHRLRLNQSVMQSIGFLKFAIVEHEQKFASVRIEPWIE
jgi:hypothetical protein